MPSIFPPRNLPGLADNWGRSVENFILSGDKVVERAAQSLDNSMRSHSGQLSEISGLVTELTSRSILPLEVGSFSVTGGAGTTSQSRKFIIPGTGETRQALFSVSLTATTRGGLANQHNMYLEVKLDDAIIARSVGKPSPTTTAPPEWPTFTASASGYGVVMPANSEMTVTVYRSGSTGASSLTLDAEGFGSVFYGDKAS